MRAALGISLLLAASLATAEVRIVHDSEGPSLVVRPSSRGIWAPMPGSERAQLLNPEGDSRGDGFPAHARSEGRLLASWVSPSTGAIVLVSVEGVNVEAVEIPSSQAVGVPLPIATREGAALLWQVGGPDPHVEGVTLQGGMPSATVRVADGYLINAFAVEGSVEVVSADLVGLLLSVSQMPINPVPISTLRIQIPYAPSNGVIPINPSPMAGPRPHAPDDSLGYSAVDGALPEVCFGDEGDAYTLAVRTGARQAAVLTWTPEMEGPEYIRVSSGNCTSLLRAAQR
jgi:hypothetical protein